MVCKNCGKANIDSLEKCVYCRHKLREEEVKEEIDENKPLNNNYAETDVIEEKKVQNNTSKEQKVKKEKSGCVSALGIIAIFITLIFGFAVFSLFNTTCEGWDCLGRTLGIIIGFMVIIGVWFLYLAFAAIDSYEKKHNNNDKSTDKFATIFKIVVILIPISWILNFNFLYGFFCFAFLIILEYILFKKWKEDKKITNLILPVILGILIVFISILLVSNFISDTLRKKSEPEKNISYNNYVLSDMAKSVCQASILRIYSINALKESFKDGF